MSRCDALGVDQASVIAERVSEAFLGKEQQERQVVVGEVVGEFGHREAALCLSEKKIETVSSLVRRNGFPYLSEFPNICCSNKQQTNKQSDGV